MFALFVKFVYIAWNSYKQPGASGYEDDYDYNVYERLDDKNN